MHIKLLCALNCQVSPCSRLKRTSGLQLAGRHGSNGCSCNCCTGWGANHVIYSSAMSARTCQLNSTIEQSTWKGTQHINRSTAPLSGHAYTALPLTNPIRIRSAGHHMHIVIHLITTLLSSLLTTQQQHHRHQHHHRHMPATPRPLA
jgi:hypothetical protein